MALAMEPGGSDERRSQHRHVLSREQALAVQLRYVVDAAQPTRRIPAFTGLDVSQSGLGFSSPQELSVGTDVHLQVPGTDTQAPLLVPGQVLWRWPLSSTANQPEGPWHRYGVELTPGSEDGAARLMAVLADQREPPSAEPSPEHSPAQEKTAR